MDPSEPAARQSDNKSKHGRPDVAGNMQHSLASTGSECDHDSETNQNQGEFYEQQF
jgi:hypothetical protein